MVHDVSYCVQYANVDSDGAVTINPNNSFVLVATIPATTVLALTATQYGCVQLFYEAQSADKTRTVTTRREPHLPMAVFGGSGPAELFDMNSDNSSGVAYPFDSGDTGPALGPYPNALSNYGARKIEVNGSGDLEISLKIFTTEAIHSQPSGQVWTFKNLRVEVELMGDV